MPSGAVTPNKTTDYFESLVFIEIGDGEGHGSGVLINSDVVITAGHVGNVDKVRVIDSTGGIHNVIAAKAVEGHDFMFLILDTPVIDSVKPATPTCKVTNTLDRLFVVGYPLNFDASIYENTVVGYFTDDDGTYLLTTGVTLPGNSGGPV